MKVIIPVVALMVCCITVVIGESEIIESVCRINGQSIALGESVGKVIDGCNNCNCGSRGFGCTKMACPWYQPLDCEIQGQHYNHYDVIPSDDCGECRCRNGNLVCTNCPA